MSNEYQIKVTTKNDGGIKKVGADAKDAGKEIEQGLEKGAKAGEKAVERSTKKIGDDLDKTKKKAAEAGAGAGADYGSKFGEGAQTAVSDGAAGLASSLLSEVATKGGAAAAGAGVAMVLVDSFMAGMHERDVGGLLESQLQGFTGQGARLGRLAGETWADNFGDSIEDAAAGIRAIFQNKLLDPSATDDSIKKMTAKLLTATKVVDEDANTIARSVRQLLVTGLAGSAEEAFDTIVAASQRGLNVNQDLNDTITEYSTNFRNLGLNAQESMGLLSQAMDAGARDTDYAADALKEFEIRARDGSVTTARGFETVGLTAGKMASDISAGGDRAKAALQATLQGLRDIEDPVLRNQAAVDLFGTKAEDLGNALYNMDLQTVAASFGDVAGAADKAAESMTTPASKFEEFTRDVKRNAADVGGWGASLGQALQGNFGPLTDLVAGTRDLRDVQGEAAEASNERARQAASAWENEQDKIVQTTMSLEENIAKHKEAMGVVLSLAEAEIKYQESVDRAAESLKENKKTLDINTEAGRENKLALLDIADAAVDQIEAMERNGATTRDVTAAMQTARDQFIDTAVAMGMPKEEAQRLADKLRLIPGHYVAGVSVDGVKQAESAIRSLTGKLIDLTNREWVSSISIVHSPVGVGSGKMFKAAGGPTVGQRWSTAAQGGARGGFVIKDELGPEVTQMPDGSTVWPAGLSRQLMMAAAGGMGGGGPTNVVLGVERNADGAVAVMLRYLIDEQILKLRVDSSGRVAVA